MEGVSDPVQTRSQRTLRKLLDATESLLNEKSWLEISVGDIVAAAETSVGSFYARFQDKDTLLRYLSERLSEQTQRRIGGFIGENPTTSLEHTIRGLIDNLVAVHRAKAGLIRTLTVLPRTYSKPSFYEDGMKSAAAFKQLAAHVAEHGIAESKASFVLFLIVTAVRERFVFAQHAKPLVSLSQARFVEELSAISLTYLRQAP